MKTSNYIILFFVVFLVGSTVLLFWSGKALLWEKAPEEYHSKNEALGEFSTVVAEKYVKLQIRNGASNQLTVNYSSLDSGLVMPTWNVKNDTLFLAQPEREVRGMPLELVVSDIQNLKVDQESEVSLIDFESDSVVVSLTDSWLYMRSEYTTPKLGHLAILGTSNSHIQFNNQKIDRLNFDLNQTEIRIFETEIGVLEGTLTNRAHLDGYSPIRKISLSVDERSHYRMWNQ
ncbi:hypothetical protein ACRTDU_10730 [Sunxiuqinia elliptica]